MLTDDKQRQYCTVHVIGFLPNQYRPSLESDIVVISDVEIIQSEAATAFNLHQALLASAGSRPEVPFGGFVAVYPVIIDDGSFTLLTTSELYGDNDKVGMPVATGNRIEREPSLQQPYDNLSLK